MKSYSLQARIDEGGELTAQAPFGVPAGEARVILLLPQSGLSLLDALDSIPIDPQSHAHWQADAARIAQEREEWS